MNTDNNHKLAIVVPCFNEEDVLQETHSQLSRIIDELITAKKVSPQSVIIYVNDGSKDSTWHIIEKLPPPYRIGVNLAANVGHQRALLAGLDVAQKHSDWIITIDADLQDDVEAIKEMVEKAIDGCDIVYGVRHKRDTDTWFKRNTALGFYKIMQWMGVKSVYNHADFRLMSQRAARQLLAYPEQNLFLRGMVPLISNKTACVYYNRHERFAGESKYPLSKMLNFAIDGITSFSVKPIRLCFLCGCIFCLVATCIGIWAVFCLMIGHTVSGWASLILSLWFIGGCLMISIGLIGEYIGKIYMEVKQRPRYYIEQIID